MAILCGKTGAKLVVIPMNEKEQLIISEFDNLLSKNENRNG